MSAPRKIVVLLFLSFFSLSASKPGEFGHEHNTVCLLLHRHDVFMPLAPEKAVDVKFMVLQHKKKRGSRTVTRPTL